MLHQQTFDRLHSMKLTGMAEGFSEYLQGPAHDDLTFEERFTILVDRQWCWKEDRALARRLQYASLRQRAAVEDIDYRHRRGLKRAQIEHLASSRWVHSHHNCLITGPTGVGKSYLACALAHKACRDGYRALYTYTPKLFRQLATAQVDGSLPRLLRKLQRADLLVIDDWGIAEIKGAQQRQLLEILDDRQGNGSTLITSQFPPDSWHELISDPTVADAICDRALHQTHRIELAGESMRRRQPEAPSH